MRLIRARIPSHFVDVFLDPAPSGHGIALKVGASLIHLKPDIAIDLANQIVDILETQERVNKVIQE